MDTTKVKLLNNYQLYQMSKNKSLDDATQKKVYQEFLIRNISTIEQKELERRYQETFAETNKALDAASWDPFYTAFAWKKHFRQIALLQTLKRNKEAKAYQLRFYLGMLVYMLLFVSLLLFFRT